MAENGLQAIKRELKAGARPNKYRIHIDGLSKGKAIGAPKLDALVKATSIPEASIGVIEVWNQGRKLPIAGDKSYSNTWDLTFYNTEDLDIRASIEEWMKKIDDVEKHTREYLYNNDYMVDTMKLEQLDGKNQVKTTWTLYNVWPSNISSVEYADDSADTVSEFTVTFTFSHWETKK